MSSPTRTRPTRSETRRRVLDAAFEVFAERGIATSSLNDVAAAAGLTKGAVYSSFAGKDDLVLALMEEHAMARVTAGLETFTASTDLAEALAHVGEVLVAAMQADAAWHRLLAEYFAMSAHDPVRREALRRRRREARDAVARGLTRVSADTGLQLPLPAEEMAVVLFALSNGLAVESGMDPGAVPDDLLPRVMVLLGGDAVRQARGGRRRRT
jgi:AcrR family transcriptional regulator